MRHFEAEMQGLHLVYYEFGFDVMMGSKNKLKGRTGVRTQVPGIFDKRGVSKTNVLTTTLYNPLLLVITILQVYILSQSGRAFPLLVAAEQRGRDGISYLGLMHSAQGTNG